MWESNLWFKSYIRHILKWWHKWDYKPWLCLLIKNILLDKKCIKIYSLLVTVVLVKWDSSEVSNLQLMGCLWPNHFMRPVTWLGTSQCVKGKNSLLLRNSDVSIYTLPKCKNRQLQKQQKFCRNRSVTLKLCYCVKVHCSVVQSTSNLTK